MTDQKRELPHVVIIGGGFGGLYAAKALAREPVRVTLIDRRNHHVFQPLLYQVATAGLSAIDIGEPIRRILRRQRNTTVLLEEATGFDLAGKQVLLRGGDRLSYDSLIVAAGAHDSYFGRDEWEEHAPGLKTIEDALEIRRRVLEAFEAAELTDDEGLRRSRLTFAVIGGGPTGAELAGALAEIARHTLAGEFRRFDPAQARILLLEAGDRILSAFPESLSRKASRQLERLGVEVYTGSEVSSIGPDGVRMGAGWINAATTLWAAGVTASPLGAALDAPLEKGGRVRVEPDLSLRAHPEIFVIGDLAYFEQNGEPLPGLAPVAMQMGRHVAAVIHARLNGAVVRPFRYKDRGTMATLGRRAAVAMFRGIRLSGFPAWFAWLFVHILYLIGFRNRAVVLFEWARSYLTYGRSARLILHQRD